MMSESDVDEPKRDTLPLDLTPDGGASSPMAPDEVSASVPLSILPWTY